jgi:LmbE family N-acetylglucosaminyl deacetylase
MRAGSTRRSLGLGIAAICLGCAPPSTTTESSPASRTLVAVFAHPDDETIVSPALARYAREGAKVYVVVATDGRKGVAKHFGLPAGDSLAKVRAGEARCSARELGAEPPILIGLEDAGLSVISPWPGQPLDSLARRLTKIFAELRPDAVVTWGPEGGYGHADHRLVGDVVTQVFASGAVPSSTRLYYVGFTADRLAGNRRWYGMVIYPTAPALLTAAVPYEPIDRNAARRALGCHKSQATEAEMEESFGTLEHLWQGEVRFQQWRGGARLSGLL